MVNYRLKKILRRDSRVFQVGKRLIETKAKICFHLFQTGREVSCVQPFWQQNTQELTWTTCHPVDVRKKKVKREEETGETRKNSREKAHGTRIDGEIPGLGDDRPNRFWGGVSGESSLEGSVPWIHACLLIPLAEAGRGCGYSSAIRYWKENWI